MGAEPILDGGGEFALDIEAEVIDALSDTFSLVGVADRSNLLAEGRPACFEA